MTADFDLIPMYDSQLREVGTAVLDPDGRVAVCLSFDAVLVPVPAVEDNQQ